MTSPADETDDILEILGGEELVEIPELNITTRARGDLAAFWDGFGAGQRGEPIPKILDYDEPSIYRRAHARGAVSRKELT